MTSCDGACIHGPDAEAETYLGLIPDIWTIKTAYSIAIPLALIMAAQLSTSVPINVLR